MNQHDQIIQNLQPIISTKSSKSIWETKENLWPQMAQAESRQKKGRKSKGEKNITLKNGITEITPKQSNFTLHMLNSFLPADFSSVNSAYC